jgi:exopolyphosphatase/guanosine-5'-triphosphate,3'-diphosphate pyrophosphatase
MPEVIALLDLGSNAARFLLAEMAPGVGVRILRAERVQTRLGAGPPGALSRAAVDAAVSAVHRFLASVRNGHTNGHRPRVLAFATAAVRDAENRERLLGVLRRREGVDVAVLSAREEARLGALAARRSFDLRHGLVMDLGGGSLHLTRIRNRQVVSIASLPLGAVRLTRRFLAHDPPGPDELRALRREVRDQLDGRVPPAERGEAVVALGGTIRALASVHLGSYRPRRDDRHGLLLRQSDIMAIRERLEPLSFRGRRRIRGLKAERADIILPGALVVEDVMVLGGYQTLMVCIRGVRDGLLLREMQRCGGAARASTVIRTSP